jgi:hypothetical protein
MRYTEGFMSIEEQIDHVDNRVTEVANTSCPRGLYSTRRWDDGGGKKINPAVNEVLLALLDFLKLEPILTPDEKVELRKKKDAE